MLILIAFSISNPVNAALVNWLPHETKCHWYISDIYRPGLVRPLDRHRSHHRRDLAPPHRDALAAQQVTQHPAAGER
jgi:hypothetical protein